MSTYVTLSGTLPAGSTYPTFNEVYPSLIPPALRSYQDDFSGGSGSSVTGRSVPIAPTATTWQANGVTISADGYITGPGGTRCAFTAVPELALSGQYMARIGNINGAGKCGIDIRRAGTQSYIAMLDFSASTVALFRTDGPTPSLITQTAFLTAAGRAHTLRYVVDDGDHKIYVDNVPDPYIHITGEDDYKLNTAVGLIFAASTTRVYGFAAGPLA